MCIFRRHRRCVLILPQPTVLISCTLSCWLFCVVYTFLHSHNRLTPSNQFHLIMNVPFHSLHSSAAPHLHFPTLSPLSHSLYPLFYAYLILKFAKQKILRCSGWVGGRDRRVEKISRLTPSANLFILTISIQNSWVFRLYIRDDC